MRQNFQFMWVHEVPAEHKYSSPWKVLSHWKWWWTHQASHKFHEIQNWEHFVYPQPPHQYHQPVTGLASDPSVHISVFESEERCYFIYRKFCQVRFFSLLSFQIWKTEALIYFLTVEIGTPHMLQHSCFTPKTETRLGHVSEIYFCRFWICSVQSSWLLQWTKWITILISHLANSILVILQPISQPNAFCSTTVYLSLEAKFYDELW